MSEANSKKGKKKGKGAKGSEEKKEEEFFVEYIKAARVTQEGNWEYHVKWFGYDEEKDATWEPGEGLKSCDRLLGSFWQAVGTDDLDYDPGTVIPAPTKWIEKEKKVFKKDHRDLFPPANQKQTNTALKPKEQEKPQQKKPRKEIEASTSYTGSSTRRKSTPSTTASTSSAPTLPKQPISQGKGWIIVEDSPSPEAPGSPDEPLPKRSTQTSRKSLGKRKRVESSSSDSEPLAPDADLFGDDGTRESSPDIPLAKTTASRTKASATAPKASTVSRSSTLPEPPAKPWNLGTNRKASMDSTKTAKTTAEMIRNQSGNQTFVPLGRAAAPPKKYAGLSFTKKVPPPTASQPPPPVNKPALGIVTGPSSASSRHESTVGTSSEKHPSQDPQGFDLELPSEFFDEPSTSVSNQEAATSRSLDARSPLTSTTLPHVEITRTGSSKSAQANETVPSLPLSRQPAREEGTAGVEQADAFLAGIFQSMPQPPLEPTTTTTDSSMKPPTFPKKVPSSAHINWRFEGDLFVQTGQTGGLAERLCSIAIFEAINAAPGYEGIKLPHLLSGRDSLRMEKTHATSLSPLLLAAFRLLQLAKFGPQSDEDRQAANGFHAYMEEHDLMTLIGLSFDDDAVTRYYLLIFPSSAPDLRMILEGKGDLAQWNGLVVALIEKLAPPMSGTSPFDRRDATQDFLAPDHLNEQSVRTQPTYHRALQILKFTVELRSFMQGRSYCIIDENTRRGSKYGNSDQIVNPDTALLQAAIRACDPGKEESAYEADKTRVVFFHNCAWSSLDMVIGLNNRRRNQRIQFFAYGSDHRLDPGYYGVREVFPVGGVVTFTARAIAENPTGVEYLINRLHVHPLWMCYIHPVALAMVEEMTSTRTRHQYGPGMKDTLTALGGILLAIESGQVSLTWAPPPTYDKAAYCEWMLEQAALSDLNVEDQPDQCMRMLEARRLRRSSPREFENEVDAEVARDLEAMQRLPALHSSYRRFVIIGNYEGKEDMDSPDGLERTNLDSFGKIESFFKQPEGDAPVKTDILL